MERISRDELGMSIAELVSQRASCLRGRVGAVITHNHRIVSTGYNGPTHGAVPCTKISCDLNQPCTRAVHAELNAILAAARTGIALEGSTLYCTTSPCLNCAAAIIQAGIRKVYYGKVYRSPDGLALLTSSGIECHQLNTNG